MPAPASRSTASSSPNPAPTTWRTSTPASAAPPPHLVLAGHTDVVPPGDETRWQHGPFAGDIADGALFGRGAVDMKGAIACKLAAVLDHLAANGGKPRGSISFLDHRRRGGHRRQRHRQAVEMGGGARREIRSLHSGRAHQPEAARRHGQDRPPRLAQRHAGGSRHVRATSPIRRWPTTRCAGSSRS